MAGEAVSTIARPPQLRGFLHASIKRNLITALVLAAAGGIAMKVCYGDARKKRYAEFYKTYDPEAAFERMRKRGVMSSATP